MTNLLPSSVTINPDTKYPEYSGLSIEVKLPTISDSIKVLNEIKALSGNDIALKEKLKQTYSEMVVAVKFNGAVIGDSECNSNPIVMAAIQDAVIGVITQAATLYS